MNDVVRPVDTSVGRALRIIEAVADAGDGVTPKALARRLGYTLPTTYRVLATLVDEGYLVRLHARRGYGLGYRIGVLQRRLADQVAVDRPVRVALRDLHRAAGGSSHLTVLRDSAVVVAHLDECPEHPAPDSLHIGQPADSDSTPAAAILLAGSDPDARVPGGPPGLAALVRTPDGVVAGALGVIVGPTQLAARRGELERVLRDGARRVGGLLAAHARAG